MTETPENDPTTSAPAATAPEAPSTEPSAEGASDAPQPTEGEGSVEAAASDADHDDGGEGDGGEGGEGDGGEGDGGEGDAGEGDAGEGELSSAGTETAAGEASPDGVKKKRRRRRKKKGAGEARAEGEGGENAAGAPAQEPPRERKEAHLPFQRFIEARAMADGRRGAFLNGEHVGGRVVAVTDGAVTIDLFGKGIAFATVNEPREIPVPLASEPEEAEHDDAPAASPDGVGAAAAHLEGAVGMPGSESLPPPPPPPGASPDPVSARLEDDAVPGGSADPAHVGAAAWHLRSVGTPLEAEKADDAPSSELPPPEPTALLTASVPTASGARAPSEPGTHESAEESAAHDDATEHPPLEVGHIFRGRIASVAESGHIAIHNRLVTRAEARARLAKAREEHRRVFGLVYGFNRGGFDVLVEGVRAFCPVSGISVEAVEDPELLLGRRLEFSVQQAKSGNQGIVVSRRSILEKEARKRARELRRSLRPGQKLEGRVTQVRDFGVFVDIGGVEGLVHMSEISYDRAVRPADACKPGDVVKVQVLRVTEPSGRKDRDGRISLSIKALLPDPWETNLGDVSEGIARKGKVTRTAEFGAFVEIAPNVEGLLHISELGRDLRHASERLSEGEEIYVVVERIDTKARRISLSKLNDAEAKLFEEGQLQAEAGGKVVRPGSHVTVKVERVESAGLHVQIEGVLGRRGRGFIPNVEMGTERGTDHRKKFPPGTEIEVKVIGVDRDGGLRCSRKGLIQDEERRAIQDYRREAARKGLGTFGDLLRNKLADLGADKK